MKKAISIREVMDPYEWLPGYGESFVEIRTSGTDLLVDVGYEEQARFKSVSWRTLAFQGAVYFVKSSIPAPVDSARETLLMEEDPFENVPLSSLIVFEDSTLASSWSRHLSRDLRHFQIIFTSENVVIEAVAKEVSLSEPVTERALLK